MKQYTGQNWQLAYEVQREKLYTKGTPPIILAPDGSGLWIFDAVWSPKGGKPVPVLRRGMIPFLLVPYDDVKAFKDGVPPAQAQYAPIPWKYPCGTPVAPNYASAETAPNACAVEIVEKEPSAHEPDHVSIACKFQVGNYQYIHRWTFFSNGVIEISCGVGATMFADVPWSAHVHCAYVRLDFAFGSPGKQAVDEFRVAYGSDKKIAYAWRPLLKAQTRTIALDRATRWRLRKAGDDANTAPSFVIEPGTTGGPVLQSTADLFAVPNFNPDWNIGANFSSCSDTGLLPVFKNAPGAKEETVPETNVTWDTTPTPLAGKDILLWVVMRELHRPRYPTEDTMDVPYHYLTMRVVPSNIAQGLVHFTEMKE